MDRVKEFFVLADAIEAKVELTRRQAEKLEQSILARAFRGELVPQDPKDEPASILLDQIRARGVRSDIPQKPPARYLREKKRQGKRGLANI
ncbi:MAG: restriction endonuclease subunit S [candidate division NC10 bacterium]|nr:restriction endonuclease subunit S [candidate division NC10 bacterium]